MSWVTGTWISVRPPAIKSGWSASAPATTRSAPPSGWIFSTIEELKAAVLDDLKKVFRPEFLNRLDETIVFTQLGRTEIQAIARRMLERVGERMKALGVTLRFTDRALETLADQGFDPDYGARPLRRTIRAQVEDVAAEQLLSGALQAGDTALVDGAENGLRLYAQPAETQALNTKENEL